MAASGETTPGEAALGEMVGMVAARGRQSRLRMREEEEETKANRRESFKGVRGERREGRVD